MKNSSTTGGYADDVIENSFGTEVSFFPPFVVILKVSFFERKLKIIKSFIIMMESRTSVFPRCFHFGTLYLLFSFYGFQDINAKLSIFIVFPCVVKNFLIVINLV
jgi:hypothetical protein